MDQGFVSPTGHYVRLALIFCATLFGLLVLGFVFGSSSASADDGGPDGDGLVPIAADAAGGVGETVATVITPMTAAIPLADVPLSPAATTLAAMTATAPTAGKVLGSMPIGVAVGTLVKTVDSAVETLTATVGPVLHALPVFAPVRSTIDAAGPSGVAQLAAVPGSAVSPWLGSKGPFGTGAIGASGPASSTTVLPVAVLGTGFLVLLFARRWRLLESTLPASPVYETDTSPD